MDLRCRGAVGGGIGGPGQRQDELRVLVRGEQHAGVGGGRDGAAERGRGRGVSEAPDGGDLGGWEGERFGDVEEGGEGFDPGRAFGASRWGLLLGRRMFGGWYPRRGRWRREGRRGRRDGGGFAVLDLSCEDLFQLGHVLDADSARCISTMPIHRGALQWRSPIRRVLFGLLVQLLPVLLHDAVRLAVGGEEAHVVHLRPAALHTPQA